MKRNDAQKDDFCQISTVDNQAYKYDINEAAIIMAGEADIREFLVPIFNAKICVQNNNNIKFLRNGNT